MAINPVTSSTNAAAQQAAQVRRSNAKTEATETQAAETAAENAAEQPTQTQRNEQPKPVVNAQGQTTGQVINTRA